MLLLFSPLCLLNFTLSFPNLSSTLTLYKYCASQSEYSHTHISLLLKNLCNIPPSPLILSSHAQQTTFRGGAAVKTGFGQLKVYVVDRVTIEGCRPSLAVIILPGRAVSATAAATDNLLE